MSDFDNIDADVPEPRRESRKKDGDWSGVKLLAVVVGLLVAIVMSIFIYDRVELWNSRRRMDEIDKESIRLLDSGQGQSARMHELAAEEREIVRRHPELKREMSLDNYLRASAKP